MKKNRLYTAALLGSCLIYFGLAWAGIHFGLPDDRHILSYNCDETNWIDGLSQATPSNHFNPHPYFHHPTFFLEILGASLLVAHKVGYIPVLTDKKWLQTNPDIFSRFYLVGRYLQVLFGLILLGFLGWVSKSVFNERIAAITLMLMAVTPSFVAASHFLQASMLVATLSMIGLACCLMAVKEDFKEKWILGASVAAGLAISTKYSGLALIIPLAYCVARSPSWFKTGLASACLTILSFVIGSPFSVLSPRSFWKGAEYHIPAQQDPNPNFLNGLLYPFQVSFPHALGTVLFWSCLIGFITFCFLKVNKSIKILLLLWVGFFCLAVLRVGYIATSARVLVVLPIIILILAVALDKISEKFKKMKFILPLIVLIVFIFTARSTLAIVALRRAVPMQKVVSAWIEENISKERTIGLPRRIFFWSPDIITESAHHPERHNKTYKVYALAWSKKELEKIKPDYLVVSGVERHNCTLWDETADRCDEFFSFIDNPENYLLIKEFHRQVKFMGWEWVRPELYRHLDDDLWATSMQIYERAKPLP